MNDVQASRHPVLSLGHRYAMILLMAWRHRDELAGPNRLSDERAFLPAAMALQETPPHPAPCRAMVVICLLFLVALVWINWGRVDIVAVAQGRIVIGQGTKLIQPLEHGVVRTIHVRDGDRVKAGQLLIELDGTLTQADANRVTQDRLAAWSELLRSQALLRGLADGAAPQLPDRPELAGDERATARAQLGSEWSDIAAKTARLDAEIARRRSEIVTVEQQVAKFQATVPMARQRESDIRSLTEQGFVAGHAGQDKMRERVELELELATAQARHSEARAALAESEHARSAYRAETERGLRDRLAQASLNARQLGEEGVKAQQRNALTQLKAPVDGIVQQLAVHTSGGVVTPAQVLLVLVPDDAEVMAEVVLENRDVGFVKEAQDAVIKLETFAYTRYGTVEGRVRSISADAVTDDKRGAVFPVTLALRQTELDIDGKRIRLVPGMNLTAEIKTGQRRVIEYLLDPVKRHVSESFMER